APGPKRKMLFLGGGLIAVVIGAAVALSSKSSENAQPPKEIPATTPAPVASPAAPTAAASPAATNPSGKPTPPLETMDVAKAVMVTVELDFGPKVPTIAEALRDIERRYVPDDGSGRTFAILDAYGEPTPDGKLLHMSMHVSSEKPGLGMIVFKRTGEVLWQSRINGNALAQLPPKNLQIYINDEQNNQRILDGSNNPASILDTTVRDFKVKVRDFWPDKTEREFTFVYSACGCPVKVMARRDGERVSRTKDTPVIFPDDPAAVVTINRLMKW
ncbi:MAG TPA: hypothetical protein VJQ56_03310, partial [Blastocatellia bacterium]|nr:hypothetical protein [Blastocatellia bacterium]